MEIKGYKLGSGGIGWLIALIVLLLCIAAWFFGKPLSPNEEIGMLIMLALSRLL